MAQDVDRARDLRQIMQRLPHAHEDQGQLTGMPRPERADYAENLSDDLARAEVTAESHAGRSAKGTTHRATDLTRDAQGHAPLANRSGHVHRFYAIGAERDAQLGAPIRRHHALE
jgi:hypothetical protein